MINNIQDTKNINSIKNSINLMKNFVNYNNILIKLNIFKSVNINNISTNFNKMYNKIISNKLGYNKYD